MEKITFFASLKSLKKGVRSGVGSGSGSAPTCHGTLVTVDDREGFMHGDKLLSDLLGRPVLAAGLHTELGQALQKLNRQVYRWNS
jgi:hypothetical protein